MKKLEIGVGQYVAISAATMLTGVIIGAYASNKMHVKQTKKEEGTVDEEMNPMTDKEIDEINQHINRIQKEIDEDVEKFGNL